MSKRFLTFILLASFGLVLAGRGTTTAQDAAQEAAAAPSVQPVGLRVVKAVAGSDEESDLKPFFTETGTTVSLLLTGGDKKLIELLDDKCELKVFADDKGTDLLNSDNKPEWGQQGITRPATFDQNVTAMVLEAHAFGLPTADARTLTLKGQVVVLVGSEQAEHRQANVALKEDTKISAGPLEGTIGKVGKPEWGDGELEVELKFERDVTEVAEVIFLDAAGEVIESSRTGTTVWAFGRKVQMSFTYELMKKHDVATIIFKRWTDMEEVVIPLDLEVGVGF